MMKINYFIILITTYLSFLFSDINATTEDGEKIILFNNGTWQFENPAENAKFNLVEFVEARFEKHDKHYGREEKPYNAHIRGFFQFQNNSDQKIVAIKYQFSLIDAFGEVLYDSIVKDDIIMEPREKSSLDSYYYWEDTFENDDIYDKIVSPVSSNNLRTKIKILMIVFNNGSKIKYN